MSSSFDSIYKKLTSSLEERGHDTRFQPARHVSSVVAHELNNILTVILGYSDRLLVKHAGDPTSEAHLRLINEAARRAAAIVRDATPPRVNGVKESAPEANGAAVK